MHCTNPPLVEVACGISFFGLNWTPVHFGLYYQTIKSRYPGNRSAAPIVPAEFVRPTSIRITSEEPPIPRMIFEMEGSPFILQVQGDRFYVNWRRTPGGGDYPRLFEELGGAPTLWKTFESEWSHFKRFCSDAEIGTPVLSQYDLTYFNHLQEGEHWNKPSDIAGLFTFLSGFHGIDSLTSYTASMSYKIGEVPIRIAVETGLRIKDKKKLINLQLISQGGLMPTANSLSDSFKPAHEALVAEFERLSTPQAKKMWGMANGR